MEKQNASASWWQTLPGILTGIAAILTAIGGLLGIIYQAGLWGGKPSLPVREQIHSAAGMNQPSVAENGSDANNERASPPGKPLQAQAGHFVFKVLIVKREPYATDGSGQPTKLSLRFSVRVTDIKGISDYVDRTTIRLMADGSKLAPENSINVAVYDNQFIETDALFTVPADVGQLALQVGRDSDATAIIPINLETIKSP